jgi:hypothetical protein
MELYYQHSIHYFREEALEKMKRLNFDKVEVKKLTFEQKQTKPKFL